MKRTLIIIAAIVVIFGIAVATYFYFSSRKPSIVVAPGATTTLPVEEQNVPAETSATTTPVGTKTSMAPRLVEVSGGPIVAGEVVVAVPAENASSSADVAVHYIERKSGNAFYYLTNAQTNTRTSNRTIPGIQSAVWLPNASMAFVQYLSGDAFSTVNTYALPVDGGRTPTGTQGFSLSQGLSDLAVSSTSVLILASGVNGSVASIEGVDGSRPFQIFTSPLTSLRVSFAGNSHYLVYTKPSATLTGDAFLVDKKGQFSRLAGPLYGLVGLSSPSGAWVFISYIQNGTMHTGLVNTKTNEMLQLPVGTIADKCVWTADSSSLYCGVPVNPPSNYTYPDDWYQGAVQFSDRIWKIDVADRYAQLVVDFSKETGAPLDTMSLAVDPSDTTLAFINKVTGALWVYRF